MKIYVGRWDLLPKEYDGINWLYEASEEEVAAEISREVEQWDSSHDVTDYNLGIYTPEEFEETFNGDKEGTFNGSVYWMKIF